MSPRRPGAGRAASGSVLKRLVVPGLLVLSTYYAVFGGEYSAFELRAARAAVIDEVARLDEVRTEIDALRVTVGLLESDSVTIERIAREAYGMIRTGESLYRFADTDEAGERESQPAR